jgi:hypothetical protein
MPDWGVGAIVGSIAKMLAERLRLKPKVKLHLETVAVRPARVNPQSFGFDNDVLLKISLTDLREYRALVLNWTLEMKLDGKMYKAHPTPIPDAYVISRPAYYPAGEFDPEDWITEWPLTDIRSVDLVDSQRTKVGWLRFVFPGHDLSAVKLTLTATDQFHRHHAVHVSVADGNGCEIWDASEPTTRKLLNRASGPKPPLP